MVEVSIIKMLTIGILPSALKKIYYRLKGAKIGRNVSIGLFSVLECDKMIIEDHAKIGMLCQIVTDEFRLGRYSKISMLSMINTKKVIIGEESSIMEQTVIGGLKTAQSSLEIGDRCKIFPYCFINPTLPIKIGNDVGIGGSCYLFTHGSWQSILEGFPVAFGPITLDDGVWLPWRVFILPNVHLGRNATIGAGAVVNRDVPGHSLAAGVPAKILRRGNEYIKDLKDSERQEILKNIIKDMIVFLESEGWEFSDLDSKDSYLIISFQSPKKQLFSRIKHRLLVLYNLNSEANTKLKGFTHLISLVSLSNTLFSNQEKKYVYYDLANKQWRGKRSTENLAFRDFLSRYGIRLKYII